MPESILATFTTDTCMGPMNPESKLLMLWVNAYSRLIAQTTFRRMHLVDAVTRQQVILTPRRNWITGLVNFSVVLALPVKTIFPTSNSQLIPITRQWDPY